MKNTAYYTLFVLGVGALAYFGLPWWSIVPTAFVATLIFPQRAPRAFAAAFAAGFALWYGFAFAADAANGAILSRRVGQIFMGLNSAQLLGVTGFIGGLLAALGALTAAFARDVFIRS